MTTIMRSKEKWQVKLYEDDYVYDEEVIKALSPEDAAEHYVEFDVDEGSHLDDGETVRVKVRKVGATSFYVIDVNVYVSHTYHARIEEELDDDTDF